jgi:hypothetical protein
MEHFRRMAELEHLVTLDELRSEIEKNADRWFGNTKRQDTIAVQKNTQSIFLRSAVIPRGSGIQANDAQESIFSSDAPRFPKACSILACLAKALHGDLGRALLVRLSPGEKVYRHVDEGAYYLIRDRYHLVVDSSSGSYMWCGGEEVTMRDGELWWFNNKMPHESLNSSPHWRTHVIFDVLR